MDKKKIRIIAGIIALVIILICILVITNKQDNNSDTPQEQNISANNEDSTQDNKTDKLNEFNAIKEHEKAIIEIGGQQVEGISLDDAEVEAENTDSDGLYSAIIDGEVFVETPDTTDTRTQEEIIKDAAEEMGITEQEVIDRMMPDEYKENPDSEEVYYPVSDAPDDSSNNGLEPNVDDSTEPSGGYEYEEGDEDIRFG